MTKVAVPITPMPDYVVVKQTESEAKSASGLYLPDSAKEKPKTAEVVAIGTGLAGLKVGDRIIYKNEFEATTVKVDGQEYTIVFRGNIIAMVGR